MSKAFTRESEDLPEIPLPRQTPTLPPGAKNYVTPKGARDLREELDRLSEQEHPRQAESQGSNQTGREVQRLRQRIAHLQQSLQSAVIVEPSPKPWDQVRFGATVTVRENDGTESRYRIVGADEADPDRDWVSWCSPLARALLNARLGERVRVRAPAGEQQLEIVDITYQ